MIKAIIVLHFMNGYPPVTVETGPHFKSIDACIQHFTEDADRIMEVTGADVIDVACIAEGEMA